MNRSNFLADLLSTIFERPAQYFSGSDKRDIRELCERLLADPAEVSTVRLGRAILGKYAGMSEEEKRTFFRYLIEAHDVDAAGVAALAGAYAESPDAAALARLMRAAEPRRQEIFRRLNQVAGATAQLVAMRLDLLGAMREEPDFARIDIDFRHLLASWFNRGFLVLRRINWQTPANILEKIIAYEAVHAIDDWDDLRRRLQPADRRCYAYFHPSLPDDPLIFVEIALTRGIPGSIQDVLAEDREPLAADEADTAVFYSISNCQDGLRGISFGNSLIKQVVEDLSAELPKLDSFVTLSPMPGFARWLSERGDDLLAANILEAAEGGNLDGLAAQADSLRALAAEYIAAAKRKDGRPRDPVARFHLANGAMVHEIHAMADVSVRGLAQSCGAMVNYRYHIARVEARSEAFMREGRIALTRRVSGARKSRAASAEAPS